MTGVRPLDNKAALVTGGSSGIGLAAARRLAEDGAAVVLCANDQGSVDAAVSELRGAGLAARGVCADVRSGSDMEDAVAAATESYGGLDILVTCAGVQRYGTVESTPEEVWEEVLGINLTGIYQAARHAVPALRARGGGAIVNVSSVQGSACQPDVAAYAASKGAIGALTRAMALDHASDGIRVNAVAPGSVDTPMLRSSADLFRGSRSMEELVAEWGRAHPLGRIARAEEVAAAIAFLAGPDASFVTGTELRVDGALLARLPVALPDGSR